jgi:hypothetical protein
MIKQIPIPDTDNLVELAKFPALEGWDIQRNYREFVRTDSREFRRAFTMEILSYATIIRGDQRYPLKTDALIDNHLQSWENVQLVFEEVLKFNGIDPQLAAQEESYWAKVGGDLAVAFVAACGELMGPALESLGKQQQE